MVYVFLDALDDQLDQVRSIVLQMQPFLTVNACIQWEMVWQIVMGNGSDEGMGARLASKGAKNRP